MVFHLLIHHKQAKEVHGECRTIKQNIHAMVFSNRHRETEEMCSFSTSACDEPSTSLINSGRMFKFFLIRLKSIFGKPNPNTSKFTVNSCVNQNLVRPARHIEPYSYPI